MQYIRVKGWEKFQHYKDRSPPWIKLHRDLLNNYDFNCLQDASKLHLMLIWLLASQMDNRIPADEDFIRNRTGIKGRIDFKPLIDGGFLEDDSGLLAGCKQVAIVETEAEAERETEEEEEADKKTKAKKNQKLSPKKITIAEIDLPENIPRNAWAAFCEMRKAIRKPLTENAARLILNKLATLPGNSADILNQSTMQSWAGVFEVKTNDQRSSANYRPKGNAERIADAIRAAQPGTHQPRQEPIHVGGNESPEYGTG